MKLGESLKVTTPYFADIKERLQDSLRDDRRPYRVVFRGAKDDICSQNAHMEDASSENDSRPLPQNATVVHLPVLRLSTGVWRVTILFLPPGLAQPRAEAGPTYATAKMFPRHDPRAPQRVPREQTARV
jgi:hypothetical protein